MSNPEDSSTAPKAVDNQGGLQNLVGAVHQQQAALAHQQEENRQIKESNRKIKETLDILMRTVTQANMLGNADATMHSVNRSSQPNEAGQLPLGVRKHENLCTFPSTDKSYTLECWVQDLEAIARREGW